MFDIKKYAVIDTDTHVVEPYDLWTSRMSKERWGDRIPRVEWDESAQEEAWYLQDVRLASATAPAMAGYDAHPPFHPPRLEDALPETYVVKDRLAWMDRYGIWAQILYPNVAGFGAGKFLSGGDNELALACLRAYNDYLVDYASEAHDRFVPIMALPFWDIDESIDELHRCADLGHRGVIMTQDPPAWGQPKITDPHWDRLWGAVQESQLSINFHVGGGDMTPAEVFHASTGAHANFASMGVQFFMGNARAISLLICGGVCHRFPDLKFVSVESGVGWLPFALEGLDWQWKNCGVSQEHPEYELLPSEYFRRQFYGCFWFEEESLTSTLKQLGPDNILFETDFPHPTSMAPGPATIATGPDEYIERVLGDQPDDVLRKILHDNAAKLYHLPLLPA